MFIHIDLPAELAFIRCFLVSTADCLGQLFAFDIAVVDLPVDYDARVQLQSNASCPVTICLKDGVIILDRALYEGRVNTLIKIVDFFISVDLDGGPVVAVF